MTDNFRQIEQLLNFEDDDTFYYLQILRRKKDNEQAKSVKVIRNFYIDSIDKYKGLETTIKQMCDYFNARAYLRLNRRKWDKVAYKMLEFSGKYANYQDFKAFRNVFSKACGNSNVEDPRIWVVDVDGEMNEFIQPLIEKLQQDIQKDYKIIDVLPTPNGYHIITNPFNVKSFRYNFPDISIHKDNPTILYSS